MFSEIAVEWRDQIGDAEMVDLVTSHGGEAEIGWWDRIRERDATFWMQVTPTRRLLSHWKGLG